MKQKVGTLYSTSLLFFFFFFVIFWLVLAQIRRIGLFPNSPHMSPKNKWNLLFSNKEQNEKQKQANCDDI
jgi:hypothetical protein